jgi:hypothetical protein
MARRAPMRWRKPEKDRWYPTAGSDLVQGGVILARVRLNKDGWYFYGIGYNSTSSGPAMKTEAAARRAAKSWALEAGR